MNNPLPSPLFIFFDISIGLCIITASVIIYLFSDYSYLGNLKYIFTVLHLALIPILGLLLVVKGIRGIIKRTKAGREN